MKQLAVFKILRDTYAFVWLERRDFLSLALPAIVVLAILRTLIAWIEMSMAPTRTDEAIGIGDLVYSAVSLAVWVMFAVAWHRRYLVPNEVTTIRAALRWGRRQTRFLLLAIGVGVPATIVLFASGFGAFLFGTLFGEVWHALLLATFIAFLPVLVIYARLSLLFPSTSVDHRMSFSECWRITRGNGWRLALIIFLIAALVWVITYPIDVTIAAIFDFLELSESLIAKFIGTFFDEALGFIGIAVGVSALSISYRALLVAPSDAPPDA